MSKNIKYNNFRKEKSGEMDKREKGKNRERSWEREKREKRGLSYILQEQLIRT